MAQLGFRFANARRASTAQVSTVVHPVPVQLSLLTSELPRTKNKRIQPTVSGAVQVENALRTRLGRFVMVTLTDNVSTMISFRRKGRVTYVRVHAMFAQASEHVLDALANFVGERKMSTDQSALLDGYIAHNRPAVTAKRQSSPLYPIGEVHDLDAIYAQTNREYFHQQVNARITWSVAPSKKRRSSMKLGSYSPSERLIRIHPALDQKFVPDYFVQFVVYHEMLHQVHDTETESGRRRVHTVAFRQDEKRFAHYRKAQRWEKTNLTRLLKY